MFRYKKRYYCFFSLLTAIIVVLVACLALYEEPPKFGLAEENAVLEQAEHEEEQEVLKLNKKQFSSFSSCFNYAFSQLANASTYKSAVSGYLEGSPAVGTVSINYSIKNQVGAYKEVNNKTRESYVKAYTKATGTIGATKGMQYYQVDGEVYNRTGNWAGSDFVFVDEFEKTDYAAFMNYWKVDPVDLFIAVDYNNASTGTMTKNGTDYILKFSMPALESLDNLIQFCVRNFNQPGTENLRPDADLLSFTVTVNQYGIIKKIETFADYRCNLGPIGFSAINLEGGIYLTEVFSSINSSFSITNPGV